jgi:hypothetical protein
VTWLAGLSISALVALVIALAWERALRPVTVAERLPVARLSRRQQREWTKWRRL